MRDEASVFSGEERESSAMQGMQSIPAMKLTVIMILPAKAGLEKMVKFQWGMNKMRHIHRSRCIFFFYCQVLGIISQRGFEKRAI